MSQQALVFEVSESSFDQSVIFNSHKVPVVVEFMGMWSEPCVFTADLFAYLAKEFPEAFIFAKVDIDEQKSLVERFEVKNIPTLLVFKDGQPVRKEEGQLQELEARNLLKDFGVYRESDAMREEARAKHLQGDTHGAILQLTEAIKKDPGNIRIAMDMVQIFIDLGEIEQAQNLFTRLPEQDCQTEMGKALSGQLTFAKLAANLPSKASLEAQLANNPQDSQAHFDLAIHQVALYQYEEAMTHLFHIVENDSAFNNNAANELVITVTNMLAPVNLDLAQQFRQRLANLLSS